jgi:hypothetical protein
MVTWCAKWQRNGKRSNLKETREKHYTTRTAGRAIQKMKNKRKQGKKKESGLSSELQWTIDSVPPLVLDFCWPKGQYRGQQASGIFSWWCACY